MYRKYLGILCLLMVVIAYPVKAASFNDFIGADHWDDAVMSVTTSGNLDANHSGVQTVAGFGDTLVDNLYHTNNGSGWGMWLSSANGGGGVENPSPSGSTDPAWIAYDFGEKYTIADMWIWNYNQLFATDRGLNDVVIEVSADGGNWTTVFDGQLTQATGVDDIPHTDTIPINMDIQFVVISASTNFGDPFYYGLSEVRWEVISGTAVLVAPADEAVDLPRDTDLEWQPGDFTSPTNGHDVYFSEYPEDVEGADTSSSSYQGRQTATTFDPGLLEYGKTYYWRIDQLNLPDIWEGDIWSFTVIDYIQVDDFEYATDTELKAAWSALGNAQRSLETTTFCEGEASMKLSFDNTSSPYYSAVKRTYASPYLDLQSDNIKSLSLTVAGEVENDNILVPLYVELKDSSNRIAKVEVAQVDPNLPGCAAYDVNLEDFKTSPNPADFDLLNVAELSIGVGDGVNPGQTVSGNLYVDNIRKYVPRCFDPPANDLNNDCIVNKRDLFILLENWLENNLWP